MKKEHLLELMNTVPAELIEEADIQAPNQRRFPKAVRTGLIAACLCAAFVGTAFAAAPEAMAALFERLTVRITSTEQDTSYTVVGGPMTKYPLSAFSPTLIAASENRDTPVVSLPFDTWEEVQAFLGEDIPCVWPESERDGNHRFQVYLFHTGSDQLWGIDIWSSHTADVVLSQIEVQIRTEHWQGETASAGLSDPEGSFAQLESYPMANGATAEIVQYTGSAEHPHANCEGYFMKDGILYSVAAYATVPTVEDAVTRLHTLLDSFS